MSNFMNSIRTWLNSLGRHSQASIGVIAEPPKTILIRSFPFWPPKTLRLGSPYRYVRLLGRSTFICHYQRVVFSWAIRRNLRGSPRVFAMRNPTYHRPITRASTKPNRNSVIDNRSYSPFRQQNTPNYVWSTMVGLAKWTLVFGPLDVDFTQKKAKYKLSQKS